MRALLAFVFGLLFGGGLIISGMTQPAKVIGFLDIAGNWDPSLALVMAGAIAVNMPLYRWSRGWARPVLGGAFAMPTRRDLDGRLLAGAALFGIGWGVGGYCPGPAITSLPSLAWPTLVFSVAMVVGFAFEGLWMSKRGSRDRHGVSGAR